MFAEFLNHLMQANVTDDLLDFVTGFDLVTEYQYTYEATEKTRSSASNDDQPDDAVTSVSPDPLLECITFLVAYVLALVVKVSFPTNAAMCFTLIIVINRKSRYSKSRSTFVPLRSFFFGTIS